MELPPMVDVMAMGPMAYLPWRSRGRGATTVTKLARAAKCSRPPLHVMGFCNGDVERVTMVLEPIACDVINRLRVRRPVTIGFGVASTANPQASAETARCPHQSALRAVAPGGERATPTVTVASSPTVPRVVGWVVV
jgi:hypothetical protein